MIKSIVQLVGDHLRQKGTICGSITCPGDKLQCSPGGPGIVAAIGPGRLVVA